MRSAEDGVGGVGGSTLPVVAGRYFHYGNLDTAFTITTLRYTLAQTCRIMGKLHQLIGSSQLFGAIMLMRTE